MLRAVVIALGLALTPGCHVTNDPLPSWNEGEPKRALRDFVARVTKAGGPDFVPIEERIAVFDNDGTLWSEQPVPTQLAFALERVRTLAPEHPEWRDEQPFKDVLDGDAEGLAAEGEAGALALLAVTHSGDSTDEFDHLVRDWLSSARHPRTGRPYTEMVYQPMLELLAYLRANGFRTYVVSGGGVDFMRAFAPRVYGVPPEQVLGSRVKLRYESRADAPVLRRLPEVELVDDKAGKPVGIEQTIGRRPIAAFGNSDADFEMLEWTTATPGPRLGLLIHHTDADREWAYDRDARLARLARGLDEAPRHGWIVVDMKEDWRTVYPPRK